MTWVEQLAEFVHRTAFDQLSDAGRAQLKIRVLDSLGCALGALGAIPMARVRGQVEELDGTPSCTLIGGEKAPPDRAALFNGALVRYLDFNDSYLAAGETCHPSDNLGAVLAAAEYAHASGTDLLTALAIAYQIQCRLSDEAPVRARGFDHTVQGTYAVGAAVAKLLGLDLAQTANAIAICGTAFNSLRVTRTGRLSQWKGLAYPMIAACCVNAVFLAKHGVTGPLEVVEGNKGFAAAIAGPFQLDWRREDLERVRDTVLKRHNAEVHSQSAIEAVLRLRDENAIRSSEIARVDVDTFAVAFNIIGGGEEGDKELVATKEQADHSLPYLIAVALLDGEVMPRQFEPDRIARPDVQALLRRIHVGPRADYSARFPREMPARVTVTLRDGSTLSRELTSYPGFRTEPASWEATRAKFDRLSAPVASAALRQGIADAVANIEENDVSTLTGLLARARTPSAMDAERRQTIEERAWHPQ